MRRTFSTVFALLALATVAFAYYGEDTTGTYFCADEVEAFGPTYSWYDATGGTDSGLNADDGGIAITYPFDVMFYGNTFTSGSDFWVCSNGYLTFNDTDLTDLSNDTIPNSNNPDEIIPIYWDDLVCYTSDGAYVYHDTTVIDDENVWVIQYDGVRHYGGSANTLWFQALIWETDGTHDSTIVLQWQNTSSEDGDSATAGIENVDGSEGHEYWYNTSGLGDDSAVRYCDTENLLQGFNLLTPADGTIIPAIEKGNSGNEKASLANGKTIEVQVVPDDRASVDVDFTWEVPDNWGPGALTYDWECDDDPAFGSIDHSAYDLTSPTHSENFTVTQDETWYWRVTAVEDEYDGERVCNDDFYFEFDHNTGIASTSLGKIKVDLQ